MQFKRMRTIGSLAFGGGMIALTLTGCHINANASGSPNTPGPSSSSATSGGTHNTVPVRPGRQPRMPAGQGSTPTCLAADLHADLLIQPSTNKEEGKATLVLTHMTNRGRKCLIPAGWAPIGSGGPDNYTPLPATRTNYPGAGRNIILRAGRSVYEGVKWHTFTGTSCHAPTTGLGVAWDNSWIPIQYHDFGGHRPPMCDSLVLGTIQPIMNGVNFS